MLPLDRQMMVYEKQSVTGLILCLILYANVCLYHLIVKYMNTAKTNTDRNYTHFQQICPHINSAVQFRQTTVKYDPQNIRSRSLPVNLKYCNYCTDPEKNSGSSIIKQN